MFMFCTKDKDKLDNVMQNVKSGDLDVYPIRRQKTDELEISLN